MVGLAFLATFRASFAPCVRPLLGINHSKAVGFALDESPFAKVTVDDPRAQTRRSPALWKVKRALFPLGQPVK